jgi:purine catabolism regulator
VQSALPVIAEALRHSLSFRHHVQLNRTDTLLSLAGQESEREFHLKQRALNIPSAEYYRVGILGSRHPQSAAFLLDLLEELETHEPDLLFFLYKDRVLVLFPSTNPGKCSQAEQVIERVRLHPLFSSLAFALGISTAARTLAKLSQQIDEAEKAWDSAQAQREPSLFYDDLNIFSVLVNSSSIVPISAFIQRMLNPLIEYDREHESNLLLTLKQYLDSGGVLQDTANALFLHVNSLKYRLRKISSLLNVSLDDPTVRLNLQMCFRFMEVMDGANAKPPLAAPQALTP